MVTGGIYNKQGLFHFPAVGNTVEGQYPRKSKYDQQFGGDKLYSPCSSQYEKYDDVQSEICREALQLVLKQYN